MLTTPPVRAAGGGPPHLDPPHLDPPHLDPPHQGDLNDQGDRWVVRGGVGGTRARLEALAAAAARADAAAEHLERAAHLARRAYLAIRSDAAGPHLERAAEPLAALSWGRSGLGVWAARAGDLAAALRASVRLYTAADDHAAWALRATAIVLGHRLGEAGPDAALLSGGLTLLGAVGAARGIVLLRLLARAGAGGLGLALATAPGVAARDDALGAAARLLGGDGLWPDSVGLPHADVVEALAPGVAAWLLALGPGDQPLVLDPVQDLTAAVAATAAAWAVLLGRAQGVVVAPLIRRTSWGSAAQPPAPTGVGDVMRQVAELGDEPVATVGVQRLDHPDGRTSWVVAVPGMRSMDLMGGTDPMDNATNAALMAGLPDPMTAAVETAMLRAGIGPDEPVVLAGYSQGGMVATRVAGRLDGAFSIAAVVTAGSPVGSMSLPAGVPALHIEHAQDYVPALDGWANPDTPSRTTVVRELPAEGATAALTIGGVGAAHQVWQYVETAELVDGDRSRSVRAFEGALADALGDGTARASQQRYVVARG